MNNHCTEHDVPHLIRESGSINGTKINWGCVVCVSLKRDVAERALREISEGIRKFLADHSRPGYRSADLATVQAECVAELSADVADAALAKIAPRR